MEVPERVAQFVRDHRPAPWCDDCLKHQLGLARRQQAQQATKPLGTCPGFRREKRTCSECRKTKQVISAV